ncbi:MAG: flagellar basal body P-ring formation protein FlgA [Betaproteobacteria bacterium]|nr:flagellar basal body P-ring formation protein FlgA [Betaproteobacteria bacterium]
MPHSTKYRLFLALLLLAWSFPAAAYQDPGLVKKTIEDFLNIQIKGLPWQASYSIGRIDPQNNLQPCPALEVSLPPGARVWGNTTVKVRCQLDGGWNIFVPVRIRVVGDYLIAARPLIQGQTIAEDDLAKNRGDLASLPNGILTEASQAVGRTAAQSITAGRPLRSDMLRQTMVVQQGQGVKVLSKGPGFQVTGGEGRALNNAVEGQVVQVRLANGHIVSGIARAGGVVEVTY